MQTWRCVVVVCASCEQGLDNLRAILRIIFLYFKHYYQHCVISAVLFMILLLGLLCVYNCCYSDGYLVDVPYIHDVLCHRFNKC